VRNRIAAQAKCSQGGFVTQVVIQGEELAVRQRFAPQLLVEPTKRRAVPVRISGSGIGTDIEGRVDHV
jgi:hypothetical protein